MQKSAIRMALYAAALAVALPGFAATPSGQSQHGQQAPQSTKPPEASGQPQQPQQQPPAKPDQPADQKPTFRTRIELVTTDVIVRDSKGQFVPDLTQKDFEVFEDGVKQDISSMELIHGGRVNPILSAAPPPQEEGIILPASRPVNDAAGRILIFFVDDLHLQFRNTGRLRELLKKTGATLLHDGDMFAIQTTGPSSVAIDLTYDRKRFDEAVKKISGSELKPSEIINGPEGADGPSEVRYRAHVAFSTVNDMLGTLEQIRSRRKALIYISDGYDFNPFENARAGIDQTGSGAFLTRNAPGMGTSDLSSSDIWNRQGKQFADADLVRELADLTRTANRANVTIYTIDPRGLVGPMGDLDEQVDPTQWQDYIKKSQDSLRVLAEQTGGIAVINQNDYTKALQRIDQETSDYYVLGFYSKNPDPTKRHRTIEIKVMRPNVDVWSRKGYSLKLPPK
ncbi:MAG: VWA domain-containing protein [Bacteroidales bacterium]